MPQTTVTIKVTPAEYRTMIEHLTEARSEQNKKRRPQSDGTPEDQRKAHGEFVKLDQLLKDL